MELLKEGQDKKAGKGKEASPQAGTTPDSEESSAEDSLVMFAVQTTGRSQMRSRSTGLDAMAPVANGVTISVLDTRESHRKNSLFL